jgi:hypothetical protein
MNFTCFRDGSCEWLKGLRNFAHQFNEEFGKSYSLSECLDVSDSSRKQPEVLLESSGDRSMVIECKKLVCPPNYYENHRKLHQAFSRLRELYITHLKQHISNKKHELWLDKNDFFELKPRKVSETIEQIVKHIKKNLEDLKENREISLTKPIKWTFRESDDDEQGSINLSYMQYSSTPSFDPEKIEKEVKKQVTKYLKSASGKFETYDECLKILVVELCGDTWQLPSLPHLFLIFNDMHIAISRFMSNSSKSE